MSDARGGSVLGRLVATSIACSLVLGGGPAAPDAVAQQVRVKTQVLVLGTFHFEGAPDSNDVLAAEQQREIRAVVDSLARFRPTKLALEEVPTDSARLDSIYRAYRSGEHELTANERQQLGFRLAARSDHPRVYSIDHKEPWPNREAVEWAQKHRPAFLDYYSRWRGTRRAVHDSLQQHATIREILLHVNGREHLRGLEELRMRKLELGADSRYPGVGPVRSVYSRDLHIFANLTRIAKPGDRILVIYGAGHVEHLRRFVRNHPRMQLVAAEEYLGRPPRRVQRSTGTPTSDPYSVQEPS